MQTISTLSDRIAGSLYGMFIADSLAMPVHWYYDTVALRRDYGEVRDFLSPRNPHPDSILWRSRYTPLHPSADILHDQARYWGKRGVHYHQFLSAGQNTLNLQICRVLLTLLQQDGCYSQDSWLKRFVAFMTTPGSHSDTYAEEYLRHFFNQYGRGKELECCGRKDEHHIGGLSLMLPLLIVFSQDRQYARQLALQHLSLTHGGIIMAQGGNLIADILLELLHGKSLVEAIADSCDSCTSPITKHQLATLIDYPDTVVIGKHFSSACYIEQALPATLYLALKYVDDPESGLIANTMAGGDNAGRGAVLGALLGAAGGMRNWPDRWIDGLLQPPPIPEIDRQ
jgi:ADP-ribosylglycohydrolase